MTLRVVLDTNIVLSALVFREGRLAWVRHAWQAGTIVPVVCRETAAELLRVLAYPKFRLTVEEKEELLADFLPWAETAKLPTDLQGVPTCRDPDDRVFLCLAQAASADFLVTGDADLLALRADFQPPILTADELKGHLA
ncbi:putative toxin-antitoxin system toxin component, PIN family [Methylocaldum sp.]|uniref:putative toxin-antitoxin system toxin component, PIN family n=1 Tax=Methylocaldum sp. TaxID=1969727 RepID=UPI002D63E4E6|nr:putative toxin-antitoxin system toxin component, PIN family [Methylocaldum sp.]HYE37226.1 putative toxin-antitoxin system toxin component, PIN family [Methylocaldum sp.]